MQTDRTLSFRLPEGWTLRKVAIAMAQEWLPPLRVQPARKAARWVVQSVMEGAKDVPLWEPGISTEEYESRIDRHITSWAIRASAGRGKGVILARLSLDEEDPNIVHLTAGTEPIPEQIFDEQLVDELKAREGTADQPGGLFAALLLQHGFVCVQ